ncbi:hypothetical protein ABPG75_007531 [Micractinium tetrahymenae]
MLARRAAYQLGRASGAWRRPFGTGGSSDEQLGSIPLAFPAVCIWGSNTGVGKTLFSAGLAAACRRAGLSVLFVKPIQTGFPTDSDARLVAAAAGLPVATGPHAAQLLPSSEQQSAGASAAAADGTLAKTLYAWQQPVSPHLAVETEGRPVSDRQVAAAVAAELRGFAATDVSAGSAQAQQQQIAIVETAGGVASPGPSGTLQCDLLRPLRLPGILVGDGRLGGISATLAAHDALSLRGHSVPLVVLMEGPERGRLGNAAAIQKHLRGRATVLSFPECLPPPAAAAGAAGSAAQQAQQAQQIDANLAAWLEQSAPQFDALLGLAAAAHAERVRQLAAAAGEARGMLWWPFTQHGSVAGDAGVTVIDSRAGESFCVYRPPAAVAAGVEAAAGGNTSGGAGSGGSEAGSLELMYDACASWWTQGVGERAQPQLVQAVAAAAARYGHVMFPENAHEPAVELARQLLGSVGSGWASRVFYTDNGSTAIEVALKMAFRKYMADHGLLDSAAELQVVGLTEGYHGDTLGAMDAVAPSPFNGRRQTPWYSSRGLFLEPPTAAVQAGKWRVALQADPAEAAAAAADGGHGSLEGELEFEGQEGLFAVQRRMEGPLYRLYRSAIRRQLEQYSQANSGAAGDAASSGSPQERQQQQQPERRLGALILEPVLQGAGGMRLVDPLYQRALVEVCREQRIPVIFDEVFTGFWRLGATSGAALLGASPDIACYAKLLTGGLVPLSATLATDAVFKAFEGDSKMHALLHGHSYTAHPIGCAAGTAALQLYRDPALNPNLCTPEEPGRCRQQAAAQQHGGGLGSSGSGSSDGACACAGPCGSLLPLWDSKAVAALSSHPAVRGVVPLGTVLAVQLRADDSSGYASNAAAAVVRRLRGMGVYGRPLGDVVYLMVSPMTERAQCDALLAKLAAALDA